MPTCIAKAEPENILQSDVKIRLVSFDRAGARTVASTYMWHRIERYNSEWRSMVQGFIGSGIAAVAAAMLAIGWNATRVHQEYYRFVVNVWRRKYFPLVFDWNIRRYLQRLFGDHTMLTVPSGLIIPITRGNNNQVLCNERLFRPFPDGVARCVPNEPVWRVVWWACQNPLQLPRGVLKASSNFSTEPAGMAVEALNLPLSRTYVLSLGAGFIDPECWLSATIPLNKTIIDMTNQHLRDNASAWLENELGSRYHRINCLFPKPVNKRWRSDVITCVVAGRKHTMFWNDVARIFQ